MNRIVKSFLILISGLFCLVSCKDIDLESFTPSTGRIGFASVSLDAPNTLDTLWIDLNSNLPFRLKTDDSWISFVKPNGLSSEKVGIITARNRDLAERIGKVVAYVTDEVRAEIQIKQSAGDPLPDVTRHFYVRVDGQTAADGLSWTNATSLHKALDEAVNGDYIHVAAGVYIPTQVLTGGASVQDATFEIAENVRIIGGYPAQATNGSVADPKLHKTEFNGNNKSIHVVTVIAPKAQGQQVELHGITITKGMAGGTGSVNASGTVVSKQHGGGLFVSKAKVLLKNVSVTDNGSANHAPGVYITSLADVTMDHVSVKNNYTTIAASNGGGIWNDGSRLVMYDSEVVGNRIGGVGAGLYSLNTAVESVNILYNVTIARNITGIFGNNAVGGGIYAREKSLFYVVNSTIYGNKAGGSAFGGGVALYGATTFHLISSTVSGNEAGTTATAAGGVGIHNASANNNNLHIYNSLVSGNLRGSWSDIGGNAYAGYSVKSSILGTQVLDFDGRPTLGQFDPEVSFVAFGQHGGFGETFSLKGTSAASTEGMSSLQLEILANNLQALESKKLLVDQNNVSRSNKKVMGADVVIK
ncbi:MULTISPECIES: BACON domain-containing protein [Sphingobacterium]|uniref:BACON domain-containing protein n=1 Tax=Sphingobacterium TaxID=28453 RepID=UPI0013DC1FE9|nr:MULTISPECIES: BACON domain-containing protein [unclassified Sphingobacterium]